MISCSTEQLTIEECISYSEKVAANAREAFDGDTYVEADRPKLSGQLSRVYEVLKDGRWISAAVLCELAQVSPLSVTARIRDLRKAKHGRYAVESKRMKDGQFLYRIA